MDAMEVDQDGPPSRLTLIRVVRTLDEDNSLAVPDKIHKLWLLLSTTRGTRLHGVEESILRWLLKQMSASTDSAELVRRYPLTWTVLSHVFPKIPAQSLGRSLAYLRFVSILKKTLEDITTTPTKPGASQEIVNGIDSDGAPKGATKKRKREDALPSNLEQLRSPEGCIKSVTGVFEALASLLDQGVCFSDTPSPERKVGAEHVKSLFSSAGEETLAITAKLLLACDRSLTFVSQGITQDRASWIDIVTTIWNLRLYNKEDNSEFAKYIYDPTCSILARLKDVTKATPALAHSVVGGLWVQRLENFLSAYFIRPARRMYTVDQNVEILKLALLFAKSNPIASITAIWDVAARCPRDPSEPRSKTEHAAWAQDVFQVLLEALAPIKPHDRNKVIAQLLDTALQTGSIPNTTTLRAVYKSNAVALDETDWPLVSKIIACDADVFLLDDSLSEDLFDRISATSRQDAGTRNKVVSEAIIPLQDAFAKAHDLLGFIVRWYDHLCKNTALGSETSLDQSVWFDVRIRQRLADILQSAISSSQLMRLLERFDSADANGAALLVILDGMCGGITDEHLIALSDPKIFSMTFLGKSYDGLTPAVLSLRWRVAGHLASWETSKDSHRLYKEIKSLLRRVLEKGLLTSPETFEAFACCYRLCLANHIGGKDEAALMKLISSFLKRLISAVKNEDEPLISVPFLNLVFRHLPRLAEQQKQEADGLSGLIVELYWYTGQQLATKDHTQLREIILPLLQNFDIEDEESFLDAIISKPLEVLDNAEEKCGWTQPHSLSVLLTLLEFPREAWTKERRKRIMSSWKTWKAAISAHAAQGQSYAIVILRLLVRIMQQPTFYEGMKFDDIVHVCSDIPNNDATLLALAGRLFDLTLRQIVVNADGLSTSYLSDASSYVHSMEPTASISSAQILLVKSLVSALSKASTKSYSAAIDLDTVTQKLEQLVQHGVSAFASESTRVPTDAEHGLESVPLSIILDGADVVTETKSRGAIHLPSGLVSQLEAMSVSWTSRGDDIGWKLKTFLLKNCPDRYDTASFHSQLDHGATEIPESSVYDFVHAFVQGKDRLVQNRLLHELITSEKLITNSVGRLLAVKKLLELHPGQDLSAPRGDDHDLAVVYERLVSLLSQTVSLHHFRQLSEVLILLLDKHGNSMTQFSIERTLSCVAYVCSPTGPNIQDPKAAGEIYENLFKLIALIIKRHRLRIQGHFPIFVATLQALLYTLLSNPISHATNSRRPLSTSSSRPPPPWLTSRLQARHADRFARLLTLVCEPSAASVARSRYRAGSNNKTPLDSATDAAKRTAGYDMFHVLETYIRLQLDGTANVSREVRQALQPGVFAVLDITPEGRRRVLNESLDAGGRAVFRQMFAEYKKFGRWSGV
ncbi:Urb2/Npa2 family-domain-containing protein [Biscogniauxia mediterranea]|nr:Urb2/Npa2 family-domain-containing protein [Biscogniauxia mediterranea]